jgi:hypothetical protein
MFAFWASAGTATQYLAARELSLRGWRYHRKLQTWVAGTAPITASIVEPGATYSGPGQHLTAWNVASWAAQERPGLEFLDLHLETEFVH